MKRWFEMTVWIVFYNNFYGVDEFKGVFSSEVNAQAYINRFTKDAKSSFRIEMSQLDDCY